MPKLSELAHLGKAVKDALSRGAPDIEISSLPKSLDLSPDKVTETVIAINANTPNPRQKYVNDALVRHLHAFVREVSLTTDEWMSAIEFLTITGQTCTSRRQEFILLSDIFGVSALVDIINHPKPAGATESTVLGPFFVEDSKMGRGVPDCLIDTWETDHEGYYDTQYDNYEADCRGRLLTDSNGSFAFRAIKPVAYPIPNDGPVGQLLRSMNRHVFRPAHLHLKLVAEGFDQLITTLYFKGDTFLTSDAVFGVKSSLIEDPVLIDDAKESRKHGFKRPSFLLVERDFVLLTSDEACEERERTVQPF
ncbi:hypothetical protein JCM24511_04960 [Saitozyma sp. JCM 24511]|nr:hypothetical protein JCM24511_04960 [Saitozyma sp. JCM 24511]